MQVLGGHRQKVHGKDKEELDIALHENEEWQLYSAKNIYLEATALGLRPCAVGAFRNEKVDEIIDVDGKEESSIYILAIGK